MDSPNTVDAWLDLVDQHMHAARALASRPETTSQAVFHAGIGVECALKALIMFHEKLDGWPARRSRPALYTHDLRKLAEMARLAPSSTDAVAAAWHVMLQWDRGQGYSPRPTPIRVASSYVEAAFGPVGVTAWIRSMMRRP